jgi:hypothetical protein
MAQDNVTSPRLTDHGQRSVFTELLHLPQAQIIKRLDNGLPAGVCTESDVFEHTLKLRPLTLGAGDFLPGDFFAADFFKRSKL